MTLSSVRAGTGQRHLRGSGSGGHTPEMRWNECMHDGLNPMEEIHEASSSLAGTWETRLSYHCEVKSTNSSENLSAGSCGDGSSTTCLSCWKGVPQES